MHSKKIAGRKFWNEQTFLLKELGCFVEDIDNVKAEYVKSFEFDSKLMPLTWIVVRIDGCHFHRFSELLEFVKPNDDRALNLMNFCAISVLEEFPHDIVFAYGSELKYPPSFDGRAVCYPSIEILKDYLSWRQVDCHINNQYNSCFWKLVASGKLKREAQQSLKGAQLQKKIKELAIDYNSLPAMFRQGSSVFWEKMDNVLTCQQNDACLAVLESGIHSPTFKIKIAGSGLIMNSGPLDHENNEVAKKQRQRWIESELKHAKSFGGMGPEGILDYGPIFFMRLNSFWTQKKEQYCNKISTDGKTTLDLCLCYGKDFKSYELAQVVKVVPADSAL
ncbi:hypothetical protein PIB30_069588 [Stylosanthes scabra]|uniref:tRNA(His) guanylyltransferase n=1 Tax=Stylosanthes scabra TaxID=79078 RepID=A0ABU6VLU6_9FABA|nr:hypothetical protein [Stylosanthes scabra]